MCSSDLVGSGHCAVEQTEATRVLGGGEQLTIAELAQLEVPFPVALGAQPELVELQRAHEAALRARIGRRLGLAKPLVAVKGIRTLRKSDMVLNGYAPSMSVDPETYEVRADGELLTCEPAEVLPMAQRYFLF